jgi:hypothetical protein
MSCGICRGSKRWWYLWWGTQDPKKSGNARAGCHPSVLADRGVKTIVVQLLIRWRAWSTVGAVYTRVLGIGIRLLIGGDLDGSRLAFKLGGSGISGVRRLRLCRLCPKGVVLLLIAPLPQLHNFEGCCCRQMVCPWRLLLLYRSSRNA